MRFLNRKVTDSDKKANKIEDKKLSTLALGSKEVFPF
jgi:hypothetical protein